MSNKKKQFMQKARLSSFYHFYWLRYGQEKPQTKAMPQNPLTYSIFLCGSSLNIDSQSSLCPALSVSVSFTHPATSLIITLLWAYDAQPRSEDHSAHHLMFSWSLQPAIAKAEKITTFNSATWTKARLLLMHNIILTDNLGFSSGVFAHT